MAKKTKEPELEVAAVWVPIGDLNPWPRNPRRNDDAVEKVVDSIKRFGFGAPIVARKEDGEIIAGHTRFKAAEFLKMEKVPVRYLDLDPGDAHLLAIADNKISEVAEWDDIELGKLLKELQMEDTDLDVGEAIGVSDEEVERIVKEAEASISEVNEELEEEPEKVDDTRVYCDAFEILEGSVLDRLKDLPAHSIQCCVTSPPYWALRDYGADGQVGLEETPAMYVKKMVEVFTEVARVLRKDGTLWLNLGDSYAGGKSGGRNDTEKMYSEESQDLAAKGKKISTSTGMHGKNLVGIPWLVAFGLQEAGWILRSDIIWSKPNPMPESCRDRPTKSHEFIFLFAHPESNGKYYFDADAVREPLSDARMKDALTGDGKVAPGNKQWDSKNTSFEGHKWKMNPAGRNFRTVWDITLKPYSGAHFATFPPILPEKCIRAGTSPWGCCAKCGAPMARERTQVNPNANTSGRTPEQADRQEPEGRVGSFQRPTGMVEPGIWETTGVKPTCECPSPGEDLEPCTVLDPFSGAGTTGMVALRLGCQYVGVELNPEYAKMSRNRIQDDIDQNQDSG